MQDGYGRKIEYLRVSVTDRCNLRCVYCMPAEGVPSVPHEEILTYDEICRFCGIAAGLGISRIKLTGGEPLVRKNLHVLVKKLKETPGVEQVTLTTNGILLRDQLAGLTAAGLDAVNISLDTLDEEKYTLVTRGGRLADAAQGIEAALASPGLPVKINCVPLQDGSDEDIVRLAELAGEHPLEVRFIEMMPIGMGKEFQGRGANEIKKLLESRFGKSLPCGKTLGNGPARYVEFQGFQGRIGFISALTHKFCRTCNRLRLTPEGMLKPCLQYGDGFDIKKLLRNGASDEQIAETVRAAVLDKPACHQFERENDPACRENRSAQEGRTMESREAEKSRILEEREMSRIGG